MKKTLIIALIVISAVLAFSACGKDSSETAQTPTSPKATSKTEEKGVFSSFISTDIKGGPVSEDVFKGKKLTMVNIWATFCGPCIDEMPDLYKLSQDYSDKSFQIIGIPVDVTDRKGEIDSAMVKEAERIILKTGANYMHILPSDSLNSAKLNKVSSVPETIFVDKNGKQVGKIYLGSKTYKEWSQIIDSLLK